MTLTHSVGKLRSYNRLPLSCKHKRYDTDHGGWSLEI